MFWLYLYGRFFIDRTITAPTAMIAIMMAADIGRKYRSAIDGGCVGCGVGVAACGSTAKLLTACEG